MLAHLRNSVGPDATVCPLEHERIHNQRRHGRVDFFSLLLRERLMDWFIAAPFIRSVSNRWLADFVPDQGDGFHAVPATYTHDRSRPATGLAGWADYFRHGSAAWRTARNHPGPSGILTCFPQLPLAIGLRKRFSKRKIPLVAWTFNLGTLPGGARRRLAIAGLSSVDRFIVHSRAEIAACSEWLELPPSRFEFVPLQRGMCQVTVSEDRDSPFVLAMGSAHRDYRLLFSVLGEIGYRTIVVAAPHALAGLQVPSNVEVRSGLTIDQCHELIQRARVNVIPVANQTTASGQVTLLDAMMYARPAIITSCPASVDYVRHGHDAWLVRAGDHDDMKASIQQLWDDEPLRLAMGSAARLTVTQQFSDEAVGRVLGRVLQQVGSR